MSSALVAWVDYNDLRNNDTTFTLKSFFQENEGIEVGMDVNTYNYDGSTCKGKVQFIQDEIVEIKLDWDSFKKKANGDYVGN